MKVPDLAHAYVTLDRFVFYRLQASSALDDCRAQVTLRLKKNEGLEDFDRLCAAGAEGDELLWLLKGCEGLPGFTQVDEVFGWSAPELGKGLAAVEKAASVIEKMQRNPFGLLARHAASVRSSELEKDLRSYVALARAARRDFSHGSHWFLNVAKARLVIHVTHRLNGEPHDKEVSGLIAAATGTDYNAGAQSQWRHMHDDLVRDPSLDPYTIMGPAGRERVRKSWEEIAAQEPEFFKGFDVFTADYEALGESRQRQLPNRKNAKNAL
jgi:hypothetical protein